MSKIQVIRQGESLPFVFDRNGRSITGWTCTIFLKKFPADTTVLSRVIPAVGLEWPGFLTQTETTGLDVSLYNLIGKLEKTSTDEEEQVPVRFNVSMVWA